MPTYEYECKSCSHSFELFQSITSEAKAACPKCGKESRRLISGGTGIIFKGSGFYLTDYAKKSGVPESKPAVDSKASEGTAAKAEGTDAKPTADSPAKIETKTEPKNEVRSESHRGSASPKLGEIRRTSAATKPGKKPAVKTKKAGKTTGSKKKDAAKKATAKGKAAAKKNSKSSGRTVTRKVAKKTKGAVAKKRR